MRIKVSRRAGASPHAVLGAGGNDCLRGRAEERCDTEHYAADGHRDAHDDGNDIMLVTYGSDSIWIRKFRSYRPNALRLISPS